MIQNKTTEQPWDEQTSGEDYPGFPGRMPCVGPGSWKVGVWECVAYAGGLRLSDWSLGLRAPGIRGTCVVTLIAA